MTNPRQHLQGQVAALNRRTEERRYFLRPDTHVRQVVQFETAKAAEKHNVSVHALMTMSNHPHLVVTDHDGERSDFMRDFCSGVARARNQHLDRQGHFWDTQQFGDTVMLDREAVEQQLLYAWLNPVRAGLVARAEDWPGAKILPRHWGKTRKITTPKNGFYNQKKVKTVTFTPMPPPGYEDMSLEEVIEHFETLLREAEDRILERRRRAGKHVQGPRRVMRVDPLSAPGTRARSGKLNPRFASKNAELMALAKTERRQFLDDYGEATKKLREGRRDTPFPPGTIRLRKTAYVNCRAQLGCECTVLVA